MDWNPELYGPAAGILAAEGAGERRLPLISPRRKGDSLAAQLRRPARELFPGARHPEAALAGLWLSCGYFEESHGIAQDLKSREGSYWHAILHRMEPDAWNSGYWFRRVGDHAIFPALAAEAEALGYGGGTRWDPFRFVEDCTAATGGDPLLEAVQLAEWRLLFDYCAKAATKE